MCNVQLYIASTIELKGTTSKARIIALLVKSHL